MRIRRLTSLLASGLLGLALGACGGSSGGGGGSSPPPQTRPFYMGTTPFFATPTEFPAWRFENMDDKDLLSVHVDDFWGVPWEEFRNSANPSNLPVAWVSKWVAFANNARATGKTLYLAASPLGDRRTLAPRVKPVGDPLAGDPQAHWAPVDANGCYSFSANPDAAAYQTAYIRYLAYIISLVQPTYMSPAIEMNMPFTGCPGEKAAWINWYTGVHNAIKAAFPNLIVFPTFQQDYMYGIAEVSAACPGISVENCFTQRLTEALAIPGDRIAFSTYPLAWTGNPAFGGSYPTTTYDVVKGATQRKIWISETGWAATRMFTAYDHGGGTSCGVENIPVTVANDTNNANYLSWLLAEAQRHEFETVIWWLNRDYLDGAVASTCPCSGANDTCALASLFYTVAGDFGESLLRYFGNMALRHHDGTPRVGHTTWRNYYVRTRSP